MGNYRGSIACFSVITKHADSGDLYAWPVQDTAAAAVGQALMAIHKQYDGRDYVVDKVVEVTDGSWFIQAHSTTNGYPIRPDINAWALPTTIGGDDL